jgi:hypothetical protein
MSNAISLFAKGGLPPVDVNAYKQAVKATSAALRSATGGMPFLRLMRDGEWVYGADNTAVEENSLWAINTFSMSIGWIAWGAEGTKQEGTVLGEQMTLIGEPPISAGSLPDVGAEWTSQVQFDLMCATGEDKGTIVRYKTNSVGGRRAFSDLLQLVSNAMDDGSGKCIPIAELSQDSYPHKKYGKIYTPVFDVKTWVMPDAEELGGAPAKQAAEETPKADAQQAAPEGTVRRRRQR